MLIKNYGILWDRNYVHFGSNGKRGTLLGKKNNSQDIDFRDQIGIYILYDSDFIPVYVGQAGNGHATLFTRLKQHTSDHLWNRWDLFSWFGLKGVNKSGSLKSDDNVDKKFTSSGTGILNEFESILIVAMEPKLNKQGPKLKDATHYSQSIDENIKELSLKDVIIEIGELKKQIGTLKKKLK